jgi:hypothetical protein
MNRTIRELTEEEAAAVAAFAKEHGRTWKNTLRDIYWYNARTWRETPDDNGNRGAMLHHLRNDPRWSFEGLEAYRLPKA